MKLALYVALVTILAAGLSSQAGWAQTTSPDDRSVLTNHLAPQKVVRVRTETGVLQGRVREVEGDAALLATSAGETRVALSSIDTLWVRGRAIRTGAIIGAVVAAVPGFYIFSQLCTFFSDGGGCDQYGTVVGLTLVTAGGGALVGAGIGAVIPVWRRKFAIPGAVTVGLLPSASSVGVGLSVGLPLPSL